MATADVVIDYDEISSAASTMATKLSDISNELTELESTVSNLLQDGLVFEKASPALQEAYNEFSSQMKSSAKSIQDYADLFTNISDSMAESDASIASEVTSSSSGSGDES